MSAVVPPDAQDAWIRAFADRLRAEIPFVSPQAATTTALREWAHSGGDDPVGAAETYAMLALRAPRRA